MGKCCVIKGLLDLMLQVPALLILKASRQISLTRQHMMDELTLLEAAQTKEKLSN
jgi:hypothetical protein